MNNLIKILKIPEDSRLFIVGDIHGTFYLLEDQLDKIGFNENRDILLSVGDLIDRGSESYRFIEFLNKPWFHTVMGNHEVMMYETFIYPNSREFWYKNGGSWWKLLHNKLDRDKILYNLEKLPIILEVQYGDKKYGVVHAQTSTEIVCWDQLKNYLQKLDRKAIFYDPIIGELLWERKMINMYQFYGDNIKNIDKVFHGHTIIENVIECEKHIWLDTGAYQTYNLTILEVKKDGSIININNNIEVTV